MGVAGYVLPRTSNSCLNLSEPVSHFSVALGSSTECVRNLIFF